MNTCGAPPWNQGPMIKYHSKKEEKNNHKKLPDTV